MNYSSDEQKAIAGEIIRQLGGNRFISMAGAKNFTCGTNQKGNVFACFKIGRNSRSVNFVTITLNSMDLYDIQYGRITMKAKKVLSESFGLYSDMLTNDFTNNTGLYLTL